MATEISGLSDSKSGSNVGDRAFGSLDLKKPAKVANMTSETLAPRALNILHEWVQSESLRKHCYAVADSMKHFAQLRGDDVDVWEAVGLLHDMDYERHPNPEHSATEGHPFVGVAWLRENGWSDEICRAILSHADYANVFARDAARENSLRRG